MSDDIEERRIDHILLGNDSTLSRHYTEDLADEFRKVPKRTPFRKLLRTWFSLKDAEDNTFFQVEGVFRWKAANGRVRYAIYYLECHFDNPDIDEKIDDIYFDEDGWNVSTTFEGIVFRRHEV